MKGAIKITERTNEAMAERGQELIQIGNRVKVKEYAMSRTGEAIPGQGGVRTGTVIDKSKWVFVVDFGKYRECFRYNQLFHRGTGDRVYLA